MTKWRSVWPCPVYVASFSDGTIQRMSFASKIGKPIDFARGRRLLAWACAQHDGSIVSPPREDMMTGYVEHDGKRLEDPFFAANNVVMLPKRETPAVAKTLALVARAFDIEPDELRRFLAQHIAA